MNSNIGWTTKEFKINKYDSEHNLVDTYISHGNTITSNGLFLIWNLVMGNSQARPLTASNVYIGIGAQADSDLYKNASYKKADSVTMLSSAGISSTTNPDNGQLKITATFGSNDAVGNWNSWGIFNGDPNSQATDPTGIGDVILINKKSQAMGAKGLNATWEVEITLSLSNVTTV